MSKQRQSRKEQSLILVVDDDPNVAQLLASLFEEEGYLVATAGDGISALKLIERRLPACVLTDVIMPHMDGVTLAKRIARTWDSLPVVLMSSAGKPAGIDAPFIQKPFDLDEVLLTVNQLDQDSAK